MKLLYPLLLLLSTTTTTNAFFFHPFHHPQTPTNHRTTRPSLASCQATTGSSSSSNNNNEPEDTLSSLRPSTSNITPPSVDRQGFLRRLGLTTVTTGALLGSTTTLSTLTQTQPANAIGSLPEWQPDEKFTQHLVLNVANMDDALLFYTQGLQMQVLRSRIVNGQNSTFVGFGPETLIQPKDFYVGVSSFSMYGAHFALELNEVKGATADETPLLDPGTSIAYLQLAVPSLRISKLLESGGSIRSAYGWVLVDSPGNALLHQVIVGERRDPCMMLALNCPNMKQSIAFYKDILGMKEVPYPLSRIPESIYEPKQPKGSTYLAYNEDGFGILLLPIKDKKIKTVRAGGVVDKLAIVSDNVLDKKDIFSEEKGGGGVKFAGEAPGIGTRVVVGGDPNGLGVVLVEYEDLEKELKGAGKRR